MLLRRAIRYLRLQWKNHWKEFLACVGSVVLFSLSDLGQALFYPSISLSLDRGKDAEQAADVWMKFTNASILRIRDVEVIHSRVWMVFTNEVGVECNMPIPELPLIKAAVMHPNDGQEFAAFENAHAFSLSGGRSSLTIGDLGAENPYFVFDPGHHKPYIQHKRELGMLSPKAPIFGAEFHFRVRFLSAVLIPQERFYRLRCQLDAASRPTWQIVPMNSSLPRRTPGHSHFIQLRESSRPTRKRPFFDDGSTHVTLEIPTNQFLWRKSPKLIPKPATQN